MIDLFKKMLTRATICSCSRIVTRLSNRGARSYYNAASSATLMLRAKSSDSLAFPGCQRISLSTAQNLNASAKVRILKQPIKLTPTKAPLVLTQKAVTRVKDLMAERPGVVGLRVGVRQRGCSGLTYTLDYVEENKTPAPTTPNSTEGGTLEKDIGRTQRHQHDVEVIQDGVRIFIDRRAQLTLLGTEMDYVETKLGAEFIFSNPNIKSTCGCGESFMMS